MTGISRRELAKLSLAGGFAALLPVPARAMPVGAVLSVASAGFELYKLSRGGGGGIGSLLAAQVRMLQAISAQLVAIGNTVIQIYDGINDLKAMVERLPQQASIQIARDLVLNSVQEGAGLLNDIHGRSREYGPDEARAFYASQNAYRVAAMRDQLGTVMRDESVAHTPLLCLAWYCELQLMMAAPELDLLQLNRRAKDYEAVLTFGVDTAAKVLGIAASDATAMRKQVAEASRYDGKVCGTDWSERTSYGSAYGHDGNLTKERPRTSHNSHTLGVTAEPSGEMLVMYLRELAVLEAAGVDVASDIKELSIPTWTLNSGNVSWTTPDWVGEGRAAAYYPAQRASFNASKCPADLTPPKPFVDRQNELVQKGEVTRLKSVVHYHFLLAGREALASTQAIGRRTS